MTTQDLGHDLGHEAGGPAPADENRLSALFDSSPSMRTLTEIWRGDRSWEHAIRAGSLIIDGPSEVRRTLLRWVGQGIFAAVAR